MRSIMANSKSIITISIQPKLSGEMEFMWHRLLCNDSSLVLFIRFTVMRERRKYHERELMVLPVQAISMNY
jgi:hypothetical protein